MIQHYSLEQTLRQLLSKSDSVLLLCFWHARKFFLPLYTFSCGIVKINIEITWNKTFGNLYWSTFWGISRGALVRDCIVEQFRLWDCKMNCCRDFSYCSFEIFTYPQLNQQKVPFSKMNFFPSWWFASFFSSLFFEFPMILFNRFMSQLFVLLTFVIFDKPKSFQQPKSGKEN